MVWKLLEKSAELPPLGGEDCRYSLKGGEFTHSSGLDCFFLWSSSILAFMMLCLRWYFCSGMGDKRSVSSTLAASESEMSLVCGEKGRR